MTSFTRRRLVILGLSGTVAGFIACHALFAEPSQRPMPRGTKSSEASPDANDGGASEAKVVVEGSDVTALYANFCRVTGTPEEVIIDFGLNPQPFGVPTEPIRIQQRTVVNFYTAKRMLAALATTIKRHEDAFGEIEIDVQKRVRKKD